MLIADIRSQVAVLSDEELGRLIRQILARALAQATDADLGRIHRQIFATMSDEMLDASGQWGQMLLSVGQGLVSQTDN